MKPCIIICSLLFYSTIHAQEKYIPQSSFLNKQQQSGNYFQFTGKKQLLASPIFRQRNVLVKPSFITPSRIEHSDAYLNTRYYRSNIHSNKAYY
ncbi:MAG: hypothetical protein J0I09_07690 [Sphingobacteriia bacterium]|nr:hypothetical protein [Sphingobacteriia bacterium]